MRHITCVGCWINYRSVVCDDYDFLLLFFKLTSDGCSISARMLLASWWLIMDGLDLMFECKKIKTNYDDVFFSRFEPETFLKFVRATLLNFPSDIRWFKNHYVPISHNPVKISLSTNQSNSKPKKHKFSQPLLCHIINFVVNFIRQFVVKKWKLKQSAFECLMMIFL
jgi:hypothetical protein